MKSSTTHLAPAWPLSLRRWIIGTHGLACQFVNTSCGISAQRATAIRNSGEVTDAELERLRAMFNCPADVLRSALAASKRHHSELALLS